MKKTIEQFKTLKEISDKLNIEIHLCRKINHLTDNRQSNIKPHHHQHKEIIYDKVKIYNIKKTYNL